MEQRRWINQSQPQTLQIAVILLYIDAVFALVRFHPVLLLVAVGLAVGAYGIANERKWGYMLGVAMAFLPAAFRVWFFGVDALLGRDVISLMFEIALIALLLHPQSREYQRIWFK
jgi:hypothetical protein